LIARATRGLDLGVELSNVCNLHCNHCIRGPHQSQLDHLDLALLERIVAEASSMFSPLRVVFTGGEPLAAASFPDAVRILRARGLPWHMVTNGWLVPKHIDTILGHRPAFARVSLSGATPETHDRERGPRSYRRALLGASVLLAHGIRTEMSMVVTRESRNELEAAAKLANQFGVAAFHFILPQPTPDSALLGTDLSPAEWKTVSLEILALSKRSSVPLRLDYGAYQPEPRERCATMSMRQIYVDAQGRVPFCCQLSRYGTGDEPIIGNLTTESFATVVARLEERYADFAAESDVLVQIGKVDAMDDYPCLSCARKHGRTSFLAAFPEHPWAQLARSA